MKWASAVSDAADLRQAISDTARSVYQIIAKPDVSLVVVFVSSHHQEHYDDIPILLEEAFPQALILGCSAGAVIGGGHEVEGRPGLSLTVAALPHVDLTPIRLESKYLPTLEAGPDEWEQVVHVRSKELPQFILLPDPFTFDAEHMLKGLDTAFPNSPKIGGLVSGGGSRGPHAMFLGKRVHYSGAIGVAMTGDIIVDTIVAQGCRPIGAPMFVTRCQDETILELDGRDPISVLRELYQSLNKEDRKLFGDSLFIGLVMDPEQQQYQQGDFLIRNIIGMDSDSGSLIVGTKIRDQEVVQFHLRDARTSADDLNVVLSRYRKGAQTEPAEGSLLFSCMGRGIGLYGHADHDTDAARRYLGELPMGGFFCNGEIGPIKGSTFLHGFTSSFGLFKRRT